MRRNKYDKKSIEDRFFLLTLPLLSAFMGWMAWQMTRLPHLNVWGIITEAICVLITALMASSWIKQFQPLLSRMYGKVTYLTPKLFCWFQKTVASSVKKDQANSSEPQTFDNRIIAKTYPILNPRRMQLAMFYEEGVLVDYYHFAEGPPPARHSRW